MRAIIGSLIDEIKTVRTKDICRISNDLGRIGPAKIPGKTDANVLVRSASWVPVIEAEERETSCAHGSQALSDPLTIC